jgi:hypothetical protein
MGILESWVSEVLFGDKQSKKRKQKKNKKTKTKSYFVTAFLRLK